MATATLYERYRGVEATGKGTKKPTASKPPLMTCGGICAGGLASAGQAALHRGSALMKVSRCRVTPSTRFAPGITGALRRGRDGAAG